LRIELGGVQDLPALVELLEELGSWLWSRGVRQWAPGSNRSQLPILRHHLASGVLLLVRREGALAGGCIVSTKATPEWSIRAGRAAYVHKLAVSRAAAGRSLGSQLLDHATQWASKEGLASLRLDCWDGNSVLRSYYRAQGFSELEAVASDGYLVRLFERPCRNGLGDALQKPR